MYQPMHKNWNAEAFIKSFTETIDWKKHWTCKYMQNYSCTSYMKFGQIVKNRHSGSVFVVFSLQEYLEKRFSKKQKSKYVAIKHSLEK